MEHSGPVHFNSFYYQPARDCIISIHTKFDIIINPPPSLQLAAAEARSPSTALPPLLPPATGSAAPTCSRNNKSTNGVTELCGLWSKCMNSTWHQAFKGYALGQKMKALAFP